jgi:predicted AlkP superfamily phosphohydrolase/phosphomutase
MPTRGRRILVLGLDSVPADLLFDRMAPQMPNLRALMSRGRHGVLRSVDPPITVPAWAVCFTGVDPGTLGIYGFRHRRPHTYWESYTPDSRSISRPPLWELMSRAGRRVAVIGMPPGYPPPTVNGISISDFLTPSTAQDYVFPASLAAEVVQVGGGPYIFDVEFRADDRPRIAREIFEMTRRRWAVARHLWAKEPWDLFVLHEIGPDRLHHAFWKYFDPRHPKHVAGSEFEDIAVRYYSLLDEEIGRFTAELPEEVTVLVASDHGSQAMEGCFCINEWLAASGFLTTRRKVRPPGTPLEECEVDWSKTRAWGAGGYYARIFFNLRGREPEGIVDPEQIPALSRELVGKLQRVRREDGRPLDPRVREPRSLYRNVEGDAPDLMIYFGDLRCRSAGTMGHRGWFIAENDTGPDDAVHSFEGFYVIAPTKSIALAPSPERSILDVAPTLATIAGVPVPAHMQGKSIRDWTSE